MLWTRRTITALLVVAALLAAGCGGADDSSDGGDSAAEPTATGETLSLVAYSTPEVVYDEIVPAFRKTSDGSAIAFKTSFGASGEQSRAVEAGLKADVVSFSIEPDVDRLVDAGLVPKNWKSQTSTKGLVSKSIVSFIVRKGNPKGIKTWDDLLKPGVKVITPNPFTSGAAKWNLLGAFAHGGLGYVEKLIKDHVSVQPKSGREALQTFTGGEGDVLLSYEYEATTAIQKGEKEIELVRPDSTVEIEINIAATTDASASAKKFIDYVIGPDGQSKFVGWGYRPVDPATEKATKAKFPDPPKVTTIADLGGWSKVNDDLFDPENGKIAKIEEDAGVSTAK
jgi:sulfate/thiosulfate transport system substrate-binding protein